MAVVDSKKCNKNKLGVAIVGLSCRLPGGVKNPESFLQFLLDGGDGIVPVPKDRWDNESYYDPDKSKPNKMYVNQGGFIDGIDQFDPQFFGISPVEAPHIDPQHRWLLELSYEAFENAGIKPSEHKGSNTAVYIGQFMHDYEQILLNSGAHKLIGSHSATGPSMTLTANRISYCFDFRGPSVSLDTACSSSLVALDLACKSILSGDSTMALAGGANILLRPELTMSICKASMLSPDCRCKSFDESANGYVRSEGAGVVLLKNLEQAINDGDHIYAVIKATGTNQDGQTVGITVPNGESQKALLSQSLSNANINAEFIQYAEAHGTGTAVGDPIEVNALGALLGDRDKDVQRCVIGSVKSNIGHSEATAGVAGLIKTVMAMNKGIIPGNIHYKKINPAIDLEMLNLKIANENTAWPDISGQPRRAMVNSFGFGGTNANAILESYSASTEEDLPLEGSVKSGVRLFVISAKTSTGLSQQAKKYVQYFEDILAKREVSDAEFSDICHFAATRREHHKYRLAMPAESIAECIDKLKAFCKNGDTKGVVSGRTVRSNPEAICFVFSGMGPQWHGMGRSLYENEPVYQESIDVCDHAFRRYSGWSLIDKMYEGDDKDTINDTYIAQPAIFATQYALAKLYESWGLKASIVVGHSAGEVAAACVAGAISLDDAVRVIYHRSQLQHSTEGMGKMLAVGLTLEELQPYLEGVSEFVSVAAINSESALTLAGDEDKLKDIESTLEKNGVFARFLNVGVPYHSPVMDRLKKPLLDALCDLTSTEPEIPLYSTVTGRLTGEGEWGAAYWPDNVRQPVLFKKAIEAISNEGCNTFIEISPHAALSSSIQKNNSEAFVVSSLARNANCNIVMREALAKLHVGGVAFDFQLINPGNGKHVALPTYAWQHESYWCEDPELMHSRLRNINTRGIQGDAVHPLLGCLAHTSLTAWQNALDINELPYLDGHQVGGEVIYPGAAYVEAGLAIARENGVAGGVRLKNISFDRPFYLDRDNSVTVESLFHKDASSYDIKYFDGSSKQWVLVSKGLFEALAEQQPSALIDPSTLKHALPKHYDKANFYRHCHQLGMDYQGDFQIVENAWYSDNECMVEICIDADNGAKYSDYFLHPLILDGAFQSLFSTVDHSYLPVGIEQINFYRTPPEHCYCYLTTGSKSESRIVGSLTIFDAEGNVCVELYGVSLQAPQQELTGATDGRVNIKYHFDWDLLENKDSYLNETEEDRDWIVFADSNGVGDSLYPLLKSKSNRVMLIPNQQAFKVEADLVDILRPLNAGPLGIIYLRGLASHANNNLGVHEVAQDMEGAIFNNTTLPLLLVKAIQELSLDNALLAFISESAQATSKSCKYVDPVQTALWGFGRVVASESSDIDVRLIDLDREAAASLDQCQYLVASLRTKSNEQELAFKGQDVYVNRIQSITNGDLTESLEVTAPLAPHANYRLIENNHGYMLQSFHLSPLAATEVAVECQYSGAISGKGSSICGVISQLGSEVSSLSIGDNVTTYGLANVGSTIHVDYSLIRKLPNNANMQQAVFLSSEWVKAEYVLAQLKELSIGDAVIVDGADTPLGLAICHIASSKELSVIAVTRTSAGSKFFVGIDRAHHCSHEDFGISDEIIKTLINLGLSKSSAVIDAGGGSDMAPLIEFLEPFGSFINLVPRRHGFSELTTQQNHRFLTVDLDVLILVKPKLYAQLFNTVIERLDSGQLISLPLNLVTLAQALKQEGTALESEAPNCIEYSSLENGANLRAKIDPDSSWISDKGSYLITGGLGGLGLELMRWLAEQGVASIVLTGRSQPKPEALEVIDQVRATGVTVNIALADITDRSSVHELISRINASEAPLVGVFHAAGVLEDGLIGQQTEDSFKRVLNPKVNGSWNLHQETLALPLRCFVLFSSIASVVGWAGQSNYAAGNAFMDGLSHYRRSLGLTGLSVNWGPWAESGMAASLDVISIQRMSDWGMNALSISEAMDAQKTLLDHNFVHAGVYNLDWAVLTRRLSAAQKKSIYRNFIEELSEDDKEIFSEKLRAVSAEVRETLISLKIKEVLSKILGMSSADAIESDVNVYDYGINSLMALDFSSTLQQVLGVKILPSLIMRYPTVDGMVNQLVESFSESDAVIIWDGSKPGEPLALDDAREIPFLPGVDGVFKERYPMRFNMAALIDFNVQDFDLHAINTTLNILVSCHPGLRQRILNGQQGYTLQISKYVFSDLVEKYDLSHLSYEDGVKEMARIEDFLQDAFSFDGISAHYKFAYFRLNSNSPHRLLMILHHYVADGFSMLTLSKQFNEVYKKVIAKDIVRLPESKVTLDYWSETIRNFIHIDADKQIPYWISLSERIALCRLTNSSKPHAPIVQEDEVHPEVVLSERASATLTKASKVHSLDLMDIFSWVLIKSFQKITGLSDLWVNVIHSGRSGIFDDKEAGDVFGMLSCESTQLLSIREGSIATQLRTLKATRMALPSAGIGFMAMKNSGSDNQLQLLSAIPTPKLKFNFVPDFYDALGVSQFSKKANEVLSAKNKGKIEDSRAHLYMEAGVRQGKVYCRLERNTDYFDMTTIAEICERIDKNLEVVSNALSDISDVNKVEAIDAVSQ